MKKRTAIQHGLSHGYRIIWLPEEKRQVREHVHIVERHS